MVATMDLEKVIGNLIQARAELGQAQLKLGLYSTLIFCRFDSSGYNLVVLVWWISFYRFDIKDLAWGWYNWLFTFQTFCFVDLIL